MSECLCDLASPSCIAWFNLHVCVSPFVSNWADALEALQQEYTALAEKQCEEEAELVAESQDFLGLVDMQR